MEDPGMTLSERFQPGDHVRYQTEHMAAREHPPRLGLVESVQRTGLALADGTLVECEAFIERVDADGNTLPPRTARPLSTPSTPSNPPNPSSRQCTRCATPIGPRRMKYCVDCAKAADAENKRKWDAQHRGLPLDQGGAVDPGMCARCGGAKESPGALYCIACGKARRAEGVRRWVARQAKVGQDSDPVRPSPNRPAASTAEANPPPPAQPPAAAELPDLTAGAENEAKTLAERLRAMAAALDQSAVLIERARRLVSA